MDPVRPETIPAGGTSKHPESHRTERALWLGQAVTERETSRQIWRVRTNSCSTRRLSSEAPLAVSNQEAAGDWAEMAESYTWLSVETGQEEPFKSVRPV